jgi:ribosomal protein L11 methyltransferase
VLIRTTVLTVPADAVEVAGDRLWRAGAGAIEERTRPDGRVELRTVLAADDELSRDRLGGVPGEWFVEFVDADSDAADSWRDHVQPTRVAVDLVVRPSWLEPAGTGDVTEIAIEPAASFGLGDHPTTRLSAAAVWRCTRPGDHVLDVGCGSGVLAIIAARCGAAHVEAIDVAEAACEATADNVRRNGVDGIVVTSTTELDSVTGPFDLVVANILAPTLIGLSADLRRVMAPGGLLVVSGILAERHDHVLAALAPLVAVHTTELDGWAAIELEMPSAIQ